MAMDDAGAPPRCSNGGLSALSHQLMRKFSDGKGVGGENRSASAPADNNLVFSPLSIYSALSLAAAGAKGRTLSELLDVLGAKSRESRAENVRCLVERALPAKPEPGGGGPRVEHACGLWHDAARSLKPAYRDVAAASCRAVARAVDFLNKPEAAREEINNWVASATNNLIKSILPQGSVERSTGLVVATAIYFKGKWRTPFDASLTKEGKFHRLDGTTVDDAQFMRSHSDQYIATYRGFKVLRMPYTAAGDDDHPFFVERRRPRWYDPFVEGFVEWMQPGGTPTAVPRALTPRYSMLVLLPDKRDGLPALEDKMLASGRAFLDKHTPERSVEVGDFRVPRFKLSFYTEAKRALQELGVGAVFDSEAAELPHMLEENGGEPLFVGDIYHRAVIEVNEEGTEAAASTAMPSMRETAALGPPPRRPKPVDFVADHPFAFFVVEDGSGVILFAGHVHDPTKP